MGKYNIRQISNLAKLFGFLIGEGDLPIHFLKVLTFEELTKFQTFFLFVLCDFLFEK